MPASAASNALGPVSFTFETVTPDAARSWLSSQRPGAERLESVVRGYQDAMAGGLWVLNGMPIVLSRGGVLLDGVQRLLACVEAGVAFQSAVARGVDDASLDTIDLHRRRSIVGLVGNSGSQQSRARMGVILCLMGYDHLALGQPAPPAPSWAWMEAVLQANPQIIPAMEASRLLAGSPLPEPVRSAIIHMGRAVAPVKTNRLLAALAQPGRVARDETGALLRHELVRAAELKALSTHLALALSVLALNAMLRGETPSRLHWPSLDTVPLLIGHTGLRPIAAGAPQDAPYPEVEFERIGPELAGRYLASAGTERRLIKTHVTALTREISEDRWLCNAQPICFSAAGRLINGEHRLVAVIASGGAIDVPVVRGLPEAAAATYDIQARRAAAPPRDAGTPGEQALTMSMAQLLWRHEVQQKMAAPGGGQEKRVSAAEIGAILQDHPRLLALRGQARRLVAFGQAPVLGYGAYVIERDRADLAGAFFTALETGAGLSPGNPMLELRKTLRRMRREHTPQDTQLAALLAGWESFKQGEARPEAAADPAGPRATTLILMSGFISFAVQEAGMERVLREAARVAAEGVGAGFASVFQLELETDALLLRAGIGWGPGRVGRIRLPRDRSSPAGFTLATGTPTLSSDLANDARFATPSFFTDHKIRRDASVRIGSRDAVFGVLAVSDARPGRFSEADLTFLQDVANVLTLAIERSVAMAGVAPKRRGGGGR